MGRFRRFVGQRSLHIRPASRAVQQAAIQHLPYPLDTQPLQFAPEELVKVGFEFPQPFFPGEENLEIIVFI